MKTALAESTFLIRCVIRLLTLVETSQQIKKNETIERVECHALFYCVVATHVVCSHMY